MLTHCFGVSASAHSSTIIIIIFIYIKIARVNNINNNYPFSVIFTALIVYLRRDQDSLL